MDNVNTLLEESINPYLVLKCVANHTEKELKDMLEGINCNSLYLALTSNEREFITVDLAINASLLFIKKHLVATFTEILDSYKLNYTLTDFVDELWEMDDLDAIISLIEEDPAPEFTQLAFPGSINERQVVLDIIRSSFISNYTIDDVLDKINRKGLKSLNKLNKCVSEDHGI